MTEGWDLHYDRRVEPEFLAHFKRGGVARSLVEYAKNAPFPVDLQMRRSPKTGATHASLYVGLTDVLKISSKPQGKLTLTAHKTWSEGKFGFKSEWKQAQTSEEVESSWREVEAYLEEVIPRAAEKHAAQEGMVQAAASAFSDGNRVMVDREAALHFRDQKTKDRIMAEVTEPIVKAVEGVDDVPGKRPQRFGGECDLLAVDDEGRLLTVEVKPRRTGAIRWAAAQATVYAKLFERWVNAEAAGTPTAGEIVHGMLDQRQQLGLAKRISPYLADCPEVVPVVAVQRGAPDTYMEGFRKVQDALLTAGVGDPELELYEVTIAGRLVPLSSRGD